jgi:hypothetical protein
VVIAKQRDLLPISAENEEDREKSRQQSRLALEETVAEMEKKPERPKGEWVGGGLRGSIVLISPMNVDLGKRIRELAFTGRISKEEYQMLLVRLRQR